jgi:hypothetical protein
MLRILANDMQFTHERGTVAVKYKVLCVRTTSGRKTSRFMTNGKKLERKDWEGRK